MFWNKIKEEVSKTYNIAIDQKEKISKRIKLNAIISDNIQEIDNIYMKIGETVYKRHKLDIDGKDKIINVEEELINECSKIDSLKDEINDTEKELLKLKQIKKCKNCNEEILEDSKYCPYCGIIQNNLDINSK